MVNVTRLREVLAEQQITYDDVARSLGVDRATFYRRLAQQGAKFTVEEVGKLAEMLKLTPQEMQDIFFDRELA